MKSEQRTREKVVAELRSLFDDEAAHYAKYSRVRHDAMEILADQKR